MDGRKRKVVPTVTAAEVKKSTPELETVEESKDTDVAEVIAKGILN